jgi:hypothetical protein
VPDLPKLPNSRTIRTEWSEHASAGTSVRRKRTGADELLEWLDHFRIAGEFLDPGKNSPAIILRCYGFRNGDWLSRNLSAQGSA